MWRGCWGPRLRRCPACAASPPHLLLTDCMTLLVTLCPHLLCSSLPPLHPVLRHCTLSPVCPRSPNMKERTVGQRTPSSPLLHLVSLTDSPRFSAPATAIQTHTEPPRPLTLSLSLGAPGTILPSQHHFCTLGLPQANPGPRGRQR